MNLAPLYPQTNHWGHDSKYAVFTDANAQRSDAKRQKIQMNIPLWIGIYPLYPFGLVINFKYYFCYICSP